MYPRGRRGSSGEIHISQCSQLTINCLWSHDRHNICSSRTPRQAIRSGSPCSQSHSCLLSSRAELTHCCTPVTMVRWLGTFSKSSSFGSLEKSNGVWAWHTLGTLVELCIFVKLRNMHNYCISRFITCTMQIGTKTSYPLGQRTIALQYHALLRMQLVDASEVRVS